MSDFFTMRAGETAIPVPPGPVLCPASAGMRRVHRVFLWAYDEAPGLVDSVSPGDTERAAYVGEVLGNFDRVLHVHHESEDLLLYPKLEARLPGCAVHVAEMLAQHAEVKVHVDAIEPLRERWMTTADADLGEDLRARYVALSDVLNVHLRREVTEVTPAAEKVVTEAELREMASHGVDAFDTKVVLAYLGMVLATNPPDERKTFFKEDIPLPIRLAYRIVGRGLYRKQYATLFPGREIPATL